MSQAEQVHFDVVIAGAGFSGLALAVALSDGFGGELRIGLVGGDPAGLAAADSPRAFALSAASRRLLTAVGAWQWIDAQAQAVHEIELTDSPLEAGVRPVLLTYDNVLENGEPASHIVPETVLAAALQRAAAERDGIGIISPRHVEGYAASEGRVSVRLDDGGGLTAALLVAADGRQSRLRDLAGLDTVGWDHGQRGIVTTIAHERPHNGRAVQHFLPAGPFAILPLVGQRCCITWSEDEREAERIMALDDAAFLEEVDIRFGGKLGQIALAGPRKSFPLATHVARKFVATRLALLGDCAHGVHPIAGQGLNLALRDVAALVECLADGAGVGLDLGDATVLERYERWRRFDSTLSAGVFDGINRLFGKDWPLLRSAREVGLGVIDRLPGIKGLLVSEAAGLSGDLPKLLKGEAV